MTPRHWTCETADHPRACGANGTSSMATSQATGSSPRVRGKRPMRHTMPSLRRIIPARAGQTTSTCAATTRAPDHPRACGANAAETPLGDADAGSSPRVRGKPLHLCQGLIDGRIIPARAGQTSFLLLSVLPRSDHPRACGANPRTLNVPHTPSGSSPRVRGKLFLDQVVDLRGRIIPARAGQTNWR